jgi:hypothetical protein
MPEFPTSVTAVLVDRRRRALPRQELSSVRMTGYQRGPDGSTTVTYKPHPRGLNDPDGGRTVVEDVDGVEVEIVVEPRCKLCQAPVKELPNADEVNVAVLEAVKLGYP